MSAPRTRPRNAEPFDRPSPLMNRIVEGGLRRFPARRIDDTLLARLQAESERALLDLGVQTEVLEQSRIQTPWTIEEGTAPPDAWGGEVLRDLSDGTPLVVLYQDSPLTRVPTRFLFGIVGQLAVDHMYGHLVEYHAGSKDWGEEVACRWQYDLLRHRGGLVNRITAYVVAGTHRWHKGISLGNYARDGRGSWGERCRWHVPNLLTGLRAALALVVVWLLMASHGSASPAAAAVLACAALTDLLDGWLARRMDRVTRLGQVLDPLADKLLIDGALIALAIGGRAPWWCLPVVLLRDMVVTLLRHATHRRGDSLPANALGKLKMHIQVVTVLVLALKPETTHLSRILLVAMLVAAWGSALVYVLEARTRQGVGGRPPRIEDGASRPS